MSNKNIEIGLLIKSGTEGTEKIIDLSEAISAAGVEANHLSDEGKELAKTFNDIERQQGLIDNFKSLKRESETVKDEITQVSQAVKQHHTAIESLEQVHAKNNASLELSNKKQAEYTDKLKEAERELKRLEKIRESEAGLSKKEAIALGKARKEVEKLQAVKSQLANSTKNYKQAVTASAKAIKVENNALGKTEKRLEIAKNKRRDILIGMRKYSAELKSAGISVKNLANEEKKLIAESLNAQKALDKLTDEAKELKAIADAKIKLGIDTDDKARKELEAVTDAYRHLQKSGKLSSTELARANELHSQKVAELEQQLGHVKPTLSDVRGELTKFAGAGAAFALIAREAMQFETAMAGVKKVVNGTPEQMEELSGTIKQLAYDLGMTAEETANIAAMGGQLGVAFDDLPQFTRLAGEMAVAFGMTAEEAGNAAAKMANVWGLPLEEVRSLGDAINTLGNNTAAKEAEITAAMLRIGGNAKQFGLAAEEAAALADAMIALGKPPEVAATAINALLLKLQTAETLGGKAKSALQDIGYSAEQMAENIKSNPEKALTDFIAKLGEMDDQARAVALAELFGAEYADDISLLVAGSESLAKALGLVADKTKTTGALNKEFAAAMDNADVKVKQAQTAISGLAKTLGEHLLPVISTTAEAVGGTANAVNEFAETHPMITQFAVSLAALKVGMLGVGTATKLVGAATPLLNAGLATTATSAAAATTGLTAATAATRGYALATGFLSKALNGLKAHPVSLGLMGIVTALDLLIPKTEDWEKLLQDTTDSLDELQKKAEEEIKPTLSDALIKATKALNDLQSKADKGISIEVNEETFQSVDDAIVAIDKKLANLGESGTGLVDFAKDVLPHLNSNVEKTELLLKLQNDLLTKKREIKQQIKANAQTEAERADKAKVYAEEQKQLSEQNLALLRARKAELEKAGKTESDYYQYVIDAIFKANQASHELNKTLDDSATKTREAFESVGLSLDELSTGITDSEQKIINGMSTAVDYIDKVSVSAKQAGESLERYLVAAAEKIKTPAGMQAFIDNLKKLKEEKKKAFDTKDINADEYKAQIKVIKGAIDSMQDSLNKATPAWVELHDAMSKATSSQQIEALRAKVKQAFEDQKISVDQFNQSLKDLAEQQEAINKAGIAELAENTKKRQQATQATREQSSATKEQSEATNESSKATKENIKLTDEMGKSSKGAARDLLEYVEAQRELFRESEFASKKFEEVLKTYWFGSIKDGYIAVDKATQAAQKALIKYYDTLKETSELTKHLTDATNDATLSLSDVERASYHAKESLSILNDKSQLDGLNDAIDKAKQKMAELAKTAKERAEDVKAELAKMRGDDSLSMELEKQRKLAKLEEELRRAQRRGNIEEINALQEIINYQKQIFEEKQKQYKEDQRQRAEREKQGNNTRHHQHGGGNGGASGAHVTLDINKEMNEVINKLPSPRINFDSNKLINSFVQRDKELVKEAVRTTEEKLIAEIRKYNKGRGR